VTPGAVPASAVAAYTATLTAPAGGPSDDFSFTLRSEATPVRRAWVRFYSGTFDPTAHNTFLGQIIVDVEGETIANTLTEHTADFRLDAAGAVVTALVVPDVPCRVLRATGQPGTGWASTNGTTIFDKRSPLSYLDSSPAGEMPYFKLTRRSAVAPVLRNVPALEIEEGPTITIPCAEMSLDRAAYLDGPLSGNRDLEFDGLQDGDRGALLVQQDTTGSRTLDITAPGGFDLLIEGALSNDPNAWDIVAYFAIGTTLAVILRGLTESA
jgi:hypothetical protein